MTVLGVAEIIVHAGTAGFKSEVEAGTAPAFAGMAKQAELAGVETGAGLHKGVTKGAAGLEDDLAATGQRSGDQLHKGMSGGLLKVSALFAGAGLAGAAWGVHLAQGMQTADAAIAASSGTTIKAATGIGNALLTTGGHSEFTGQEMATAFAGVAGQLKATEGHALSTAQAMDVMSASDELATAKQIDLGTATSSVAGIMQAYGLKTADAAHVSDVLFTASTATGQSVDALSSQLEKVRSKLGPTAGSVGDLSGLLVDMANQGISGRAALGALSSGLTSIMSPSTATQAAIKALGLNVFDANGKFLGMSAVIGQLAPKFAHMSQEQQLSTAKTLFGSAAAKQMTAVIDAGIPAYDKATQSVNQMGAAHAAAAKQSSTLKVEEETLKAEVSDLATRVGQVLIPIITSMIAWFVKATTFVTDHKTVLIALAAVVTGVLGTAIAVFTVNKMAAFGKSFTDASGHVKSFASDVQSAVKKVIGLFGEQTSAADAAGTNIKENAAKSAEASTAASETISADAAKNAEATTTAASTMETENATAATSMEGLATAAGTSAGEIATAETAAAGDVTAAAATIEGENTTAAGSFAGPGTAAAAASVEVDAAVGGEAVAVGDADTAIEAANVTAGASFTALLGPIALVAAAAYALHNALPHDTNLGAQGSGIGTAGGRLPAGASGPGGLTNRATLHTGTNLARLTDLSSFSEHTDLLPDSNTKVTGPTGISHAPTTVLGYGGDKKATHGAGLIGGTIKHPDYGVSTNNPNPAATRAAGGGGSSDHTAVHTAPLSAAAAKKLSDARTALAVTIGKEIAATDVSITAIEKEAKGGTPADKLTAGAQVAELKAAQAVQIAQQRAALTTQTSAQKTELSKQSSDAQAGTTDLNKLLSAVHSGSMKTIGAALKDVHGAGLTKLEHDLDHDHSSALSALSGKLNAVHKEAMAVYVKDQDAAAAKAWATWVTDAKANLKTIEADMVTAYDTWIGNEATVLSAASSAQAAGITDSTKVFLDQQAQVGLTGAALIAAQAQTAFDTITMQQNGLIAAAQAKLDNDTAAGASSTVLALDAAAVSKAQGTASVLEATAQSVLDKANAAATAASTAASDAATKASAATDLIAAQAGQANTLLADQAGAQADKIAGDTRVFLDTQAQAGLAGADLIAAQAQTAFDTVTETQTAAIDSAQQAVDAAATGDATAQQAAASLLAQAQATATIQEALAQAVLDKASAAAGTADSAASSTPTAAAAGAAAAAAPITLNIYGANMSASELLSEIGWSITTGALPIAKPAPVPG